MNKLERGLGMWEKQEDPSFWKDYALAIGVALVALPVVWLVAVLILSI